MSLDSFTYSKHYVFKQNLFSTTKRLMTLKFSSISFDSIPFSATSFELIEFSEVIKIEVPEKNDKDLVIVYKKKGQNINLEISSYNRPLLLIELYKAQDLYKCYKKSYKDLFELIGYQVFCERVQEEVRLELTRTCLKGHFLKKINEFSDSNENQLQETFVNKKNQEIPDFIINLNQVKSINRQDDGFYLILNVSEIMYYFQFEGDQLKRLDFFLEEIRSNSEDYCKGFIPIECLNKPLELKLSYKTLQSFIFQEKVYKVSLSKNDEELILLTFNEEFLFEISLETQNLLNKMPLMSISSILRCDYPEPTGLQFLFIDKSCEEYHFNGFARDVFISNLQYLIFSKKPDFFNLDFILSKRVDSRLKVEPKNDKIELNFRLDAKIEGFFNNEPDFEYEHDLMKRIQAPKREENFNELLKEFTNNMTLKKFDYQDNKVLILLIEKFLSFLNVFNHKDFKELTNILSGLSMYQNIELSEKLLKKPEVLKAKADYQKRLELFKINFPLKINSLTIELNTYPQISYYLSEILKAISILINNKGFFKEIATNKKELLYEKFLTNLLKLSKSSHQVLSYLSWTFIRYLTNFQPIDSKSECLNKYFLINTPSIDILSNLLSFFSNRIKYSDSMGFSAIAALKLLKSWLKDRRESTSVEDFDKIIRLLMNKESILFLVSAVDIENPEILSKVSLILLLLFDYGQGKHLQKLQKIMFESSAVFLTYFRAAFSSKISVLRLLSINVLSRVLQDNGEACSLILRIIPKNLLTLIKTPQSDLSKWTVDLWEQFFEVLTKDYNTAGEIWDAFTRNELIDKLQNVEKGFLKRMQEIIQQKKEELLHSDSEKEKTLDFTEFLKFNHEEFNIEYISLRSYCLVGRYYLNLLLKDDEINPHLSVNVTHVYRFWTELNFAFISKESFEEKSLVLKVMILLMKEYHSQIKDVSSLGYFLNLLLDEAHIDYRYLILQLIYTSLTREDARANIRLFLGCSGVEKLFLLLSKLISIKKEEELIEGGIIEKDYTDGGFALDGARRKNEKTANSALFVLEIIKALFSTKEDIALELMINVASERNIVEKENFKDDKSLIELYPAKPMKDYLKNELYVEILCNCFLDIEPKIWLTVLEIMRKELLSRELFTYFIKYKGFFDFLMLRFSKETHHQIIEIIIILQKLILENPLQINYLRMYSQFSFEELAEPTIKKSIEFFPFLKYFPKSLLFRLLFSGKTSEFLDIFYSEKYEVPDLIWNSEMRIFLRKTLESQLLPHSNALLEYVQRRFSSYPPRTRQSEIHISQFFSSDIPENLNKSQINQELTDDIEYLEKQQDSPGRKPVISREIPKEIYRELIEMPRYCPKSMMPLVYECVEKEVKCGPIFLRVWNSKDFKDFVIEKQNIEKFLRNLEAKIVILMQEIKENEGNTNGSFEKYRDELLHISISLSKAIKRYNIQNYSSFEETLEILQHFSENKGNDPFLRKLFILTGIRSIYRAISIENSGNLENFIRKKGFLAIFKLFVIEMEAIYQRVADGIFELDIQELKILIKIIKVFLLFTEKIKEELLNFDPKLQKDLFQVFSKCSMLILRFISAKNSENFDLDWVFAGSAMKMKGKFDFSVIFLDFMVDFSLLLERLSIESSLASLFVESGLGFFALRMSLEYGIIESNKNSQRFIAVYTEFIYSMSLILRNLNIWAYETYILNNNGGSKKLDITTGSSRKTSRIFLGIHKLSKRSKDLLSGFYEALYTLILRENLMNLLEKYQEPDVSRSENLIDFLKILNKNNEELRFLWTSENHDDLKELLEDYLKKVLITETFDEKDLSQMKSYQYALYLNELIIEDLFIRVYNQNPETQKLPNAGYFLKLLFSEIEINWQRIAIKTPFSYGNTNEKRLKSALVLYFSRVLQSIQAVSHILRLQALDNVFLEKQHFGILILSLTKVQHNLESLGFDANNSLINEGFKLIEKEIFQILARLTQQSEGIISFIQNKGAILGFIKTFRGNTEFCKGFLFEILKNISHQSHFFNFLGKFGFVSYFFEFALKTEIFPIDLRKKAYEFMLIFIQEKEGPYSYIVKRILSYFPKSFDESILQSDQFLNQINSELEEKTEMWTPLMRKELWKVIKNENDEYQDILNKLESEFIPLDMQIIQLDKEEKHELKQPEIKEEVIVNKIFLSSLVKSPAMISSIISDEDRDLYISGLINRNQKNVEAISDGINLYKAEGNRVLHEALLISSTMLLTLEQILLIKKNGENVVLDGKKLEKWVELLKIKGIHGHLRCILEEIWLMILELEVSGTENCGEFVDLASILLEEGIDSKKEGEEKKEDDEDKENFESFRFIEEIILLHVILKMMLKDRKTMALVHSKCLGILIRFLEEGENKNYLDVLINNILALLVKDLEFGESTIEILSKKPYINIEKDFEKTKPRDFDFTLIWRILVENCDLSSHLEKTFNYYCNENVVVNFTLPVISEYILRQLPIYNEDVKKEIFEIEEFILQEIDTAKNHFMNSQEKSS